MLAALAPNVLVPLVPVVSNSTEEASGKRRTQRPETALEENEPPAILTRPADAARRWVFSLRGEREAVDGHLVRARLRLPPSAVFVESLPDQG